MCSKKSPSDVLLLNIKIVNAVIRIRLAFMRLLPRMQLIGRRSQALLKE
jgi:hypothetical protein